MTLANPRKIIGAYTPPAKQTSYFGLPARTDANYETDPSKIADTTTLGGALSGMAIAAGNGIRNLTGRTYNAIAATGTPTTTMEQRNAAFPAQNVARYQPQGVRPAAPAPQAAPLKMLPAHTAGMRLYTPTPDTNPLGGGTVTAPPVKRGIRRAAPAAWSPAPAGYEQEAAAPVETAAPQVQAGPTPMVQELPVQGAEFDSKNAEIPGANGGFGLTRNADGTVDQMFSLRQRTAAEDAANPRQTSEAYPPAPAGIRLRPGDLGYTGSQQAWEDEQDANRIASRPFGFKMAAAQLAQRVQDETEANNMRKFGLDSAQTAANVQHLGTEDQKISTEIPWIGPTAAAGVRQTLASADNLSANAGKTSEETKYVGPQAQAEIQYKKDAGLGIRSGVAVSQAMLPWNIDNIKSEIGLRAKAGEAQLTKAEQASAKNEEIKYTNAAKAFDTYLNQNPGDRAGAQAAYSDQLRAYDAAKAGEVPIVTPAEKGSKGFLGIGRKEAKPSTITYVPKASAPPAGYAPTGKTIGGKAAFTGPDGKIYTF